MYKLILYVIFSFIDNFICLYYLVIVNKSYLLMKTSLNNGVQIFVLVGYSLNSDEHHVMSWFFKSDNTNSSPYMLQCSCAILFVKRIYYFWKIYGVSVNIPYPVLRKINAYPLHDEGSFLVCKSKITSIVKTLKKNLIRTYVYN